MTHRVILFGGTHSVGESSFEGLKEISINDVQFTALKMAGVIAEDLDGCSLVDDVIKAKTEPTIELVTKDDTNLEELTFSELKEIAKEKGITVKVGVGKDKLIKLLTE